MLVTGVQRIRGRRNLFRISFDDGTKLEVSDAAILRSSLAEGVELSEPGFSDLLASESRLRANNLAYNYISYRPRSRREVVTHLVHKGCSQDVAEAAAENLQSLQLLDDLRFARMLVRDLLSRRRSGISYIRQKLLAKGVARQTVDEVLAELVSPEGQAQTALQVASNRLRLQQRQFAHLDRMKRKQRLYQYLLRRGFSSDIASRTVRELAL